jgi:hypothetical protein
MLTDGAPPRFSEPNVHQDESAYSTHRPVAWVSCLLLFAAAFARAEPQPSAPMLEPVRELVAFMSTLRPGDHPDVFVHRGLCIVENFAPYVFCGPGAPARWEAGFRAHAAEGALSALVAQFGEAYDFSESGRRAYFSLPTTWTGLTHGRRFEEHGAWVFVLERGAAGWRILGYAWGVTSYTESAP